jgi:hypothetical protein
MDRLKDAGRYADDRSTGNRRISVRIDKTGIEVKAVHIVNGKVDRHESMYRLHSDLMRPGESGRGEIIDTIDRVVDRIKHVPVHELVKHLDKGGSVSLNPVHLVLV